MYTMYTSGSTGRPKGVMIPHSGANNYVAWQAADIALKTNKDWTQAGLHRILAKTSICFDVCVWEVFVSLTRGATLVILPARQEGDANAIVSTITLHQVTIAHFVPTMFTLFVDSGMIDTCTSLEYVVAGGEALSPKVAGRCHTALPHAIITNSYGPTEASIGVSFEQYDPNRNWEGIASVPIGRPIDNTQLVILDKNLNIVPVGVAGELYMAGVNLAHGYHRRASLTAERFIPNPFSIDGSLSAGSRLYASGDLCRYLPDGRIEFLGRIDFQVKVRGYRIETGEIEAALRKHPLIIEAVVLVFNIHGDNKLVAYVTSSRPDQPDLVSDLRKFLSAELPPYMIPTHFFVLDHFPLTSNGKLNRSMLPQPDEQSDTVFREDYVAPQTPLQRTLADIWCRVLHVDRVGIHDKFFEIGGDSITAIKLSAAAHAVGIPVTVRMLLSQQTIANVAQALTSGDSTHVPPTHPTFLLTPLPFSRNLRNYSN